MNATAVRAAVSVAVGSAVLAVDQCLTLLGDRLRVIGGRAKLSFVVGGSDIARLGYRLIAAFFFLFLASSAQSGNWTGAYIGIHGGYVWQDGVILHDSSALGPRGVEFGDGIIGGQIGYLFQSGNFVFGIEGDATAPRRDDDFISDEGLGDLESVSLEAKYLASVRGKLGYAFRNVLVFGTVGIGFTEYELSVQDLDSPSAFGSIESDEEGVVWGGGVQVKAGDNVFIGAEYLHYDVGKTIDTSNGAILNDADAGDFLRFDDVDVIRASINIKLGGWRDRAPLK